MTKPVSSKSFVLYADDDLDDLELVVDAFARFSQNVEVLTYTSAVQALAYLNNLPASSPAPCLIIFDINMPLLNGKDALMQLRLIDRFDNVPVILFSTSSLDYDRTFAKKYDAGFISKPIDLQQMEKITSQFIDHCSDETRDKIRKQIL
ncbi:MAG TPA: response regulator [Chitinophagaceae bacterium]|jgi:CheY-like chemotaxis protein|nr:response regulator [Chitinophagaceae bacterium]